MKKYLVEHNIKNIRVISAGTTEIESDISNHCFAHFEELEKMKIDISAHKRKPLTQKMVDDADLIVAIAEHHQDWIEENFHIYAPLFSEIISGKKESIRIPSPDSSRVR